MGQDFTRSDFVSQRTSNVLLNLLLNGATSPFSDIRGSERPSAA